MTLQLVTFANVVLAGLVVGTVFGIYLGYNPSRLSASAYIEQQQTAIRGLNVAMPVLGAICVVLTLVHALLVRATRATFFTLIVAAAFLIASGLVTRFGNQPINAVVITWRASAPPPGWQTARDRWWRWHAVRTLTGLAGFLCVVAASV